MGARDAEWNVLEKVNIAAKMDRSQQGTNGFFRLPLCYGAHGRVGGGGRSGSGNPGTFSGLSNR